MLKCYKMTGLKPVCGALTNDFIKTLDLGIDGFFVPVSERLTCKVTDTATPSQISRHPEEIKKAYEKCGYKNVTVSEV